MSGSSRFAAVPCAVLQVLCAVLLVLAGVARADDYPNRRITFIVPFPPGASSDAMARIVAERMSPRLGQPVVVESKPGAAGYIGHDYVARSAPDGYTMVLSNQVLITPPEMYAVKDFDPSKLAHLGLIATGPFIVVVPSELPVKTFQDLIALARANPGKYNYGVYPNSVMQLDMIQFFQLVKASMLDVPFNGSAPIAAALLGNQIQMSFLSVSVIPQIQAGKVRALAVTSKTRWARMPDVPSMTEVGLDFESGFWFGVSVPVETPQPIQDRLVHDLGEVMKLPDVRDTVVKIGMIPADPSPVEMAKRVQRERAQSEAAYKLLQTPVKK